MMRDVHLCGGAFPTTRVGVPVQCALDRRERDGAEQAWHPPTVPAPNSETMFSSSVIFAFLMSNAAALVLSAVKPFNKEPLMAVAVFPADVEPCMMTQGSSRLAAASAVVMVPTAAFASADDYMSKEQEDQQTLVLVVITLIVLLSPTIGIQMARGAIASVAEEDDDRFRGTTDPLWGVSPDAKKKKKQAELQARLAAEKKKSKPFWQR